jgi:hypothetical protein
VPTQQQFQLLPVSSVLLLPPLACCKSMNKYYIDSRKGEALRIFAAPSKPATDYRFNTFA